MSGQEQPLYRSGSDRMVGGVCGGLASYFGIDASMVMLLAVGFVVMSWAGLRMAWPGPSRLLRT